MRIVLDHVTGSARGNRPREYRDGSGVSESSSGDDSDGSEVKVVASEQFDEESYKTLTLLRGKNPKIYNKETKFFQNSDDNTEDKEKRIETKERKLGEKERRFEELDVLREIGRKEIQKRIQKEVAGRGELPFKEEELDEDFAPEAYVRRMQEVFQKYKGLDEDESLNILIDESLPFVFDEAAQQQQPYAEHITNSEFEDHAANEGDWDVEDVLIKQSKSLRSVKNRGIKVVLVI